MKKEQEVKTPTTPNFILVGGLATSVEEFTDEELRKIGEEWTKELIKKANKKRNYIH